MKRVLYTPSHYLPPDLRQLMLLDLDVMEPEILIRDIAEHAYAESPHLFCGNEPQVYYKLRYTPPYEPFNELRKLILRIRSATGLNNRYRGLIAIDASEYKGHEQEEYFIVLLKYLYDTAYDSRLIIVCSQYEPLEIRKLQTVCSRYYPITKKKQHYYENKILESLIRINFQKNHIAIDSTSVSLIASMLTVPELKPYWTIQLIENLPADMQPKDERVSDKTTVISKTDIHRYFSDPDNSICLLAGHPLISEITQEDEYGI